MIPKEISSNLLYNVPDPEKLLSTLDLSFWHFPIKSEKIPFNYRVPQYRCMEDISKLLLPFSSMQALISVLFYCIDKTPEIEYDQFLRKCE